MRFSHLGNPSSRPTALRALTYLAPGIPLGFFELMTRVIGHALGRDVTLDSDPRASGPMHDHPNPFGGHADGYDIGFVCAPSFLALRHNATPPVELVPAAFAFEDERLAATAHYFTEFVVRRDRRFGEFGDLAGTRWGYNDHSSLSGYHSVLQALAERRLSRSFFGEARQTGSHEASVQALVDGDIECAAIDSVVLRRMLRERPALARRFRVMESWGPFPIQPIVVRAGTDEATKRKIADALLRLGENPAHARAARSFGLVRCCPVDESHYSAQLQVMRSLGLLET